MSCVFSALEFVFIYQGFARLLLPLPVIQLSLLVLTTRFITFHYSIASTVTGKNNGFPFLDILGYLKNTHKNPKFGKVRRVPTGEFPTKFPDWDLSHSSKFGIFVGIH